MYFLSGRFDAVED